MNGRIFFRLLLALVLVAGAVGIGLVAFNAGVARGLAVSATPGVIAPSPGGAPYPYYVAPFFHPRPFAFGFFGLLFPLLLIFLFLGLLRAAFWHGRGGWGGPGHFGPWGKGVPPMFEEWHRRAHEAPAQPAEKA